MKVYVVESMCYGECEGVIGVFSTYEKAEEYANKQLRKTGKGTGYPIIETEVDDPFYMIVV
jgi:hypothetical protein